MPTIRICEAATRALQDAAVDAGGDSLRFEINERFDHKFVFGSPAEGDIAVDANGLTLLLDPSSARRADGVSVDVVERPNGPEFTVTNPSGPRRSKQIELRRDCEATLIPSGEKVQLSLGERVVLTQALGGSYTVQTDMGRLARIAAHDADALGYEVKPASHEPDEGTGSFDLQHVIEQLKTVFDPEIPVNVVDLGLVYACEAHPIDGGGHRVEIKMSMTAPGCGMGDVLKEDARAKVQAVPGVTEVNVEIVWDPPWDQGRMSEAARLQLGML
jgi:probable FeS assembly SUF system protein SufT